MKICVEYAVDYKKSLQVMKIVLIRLVDSTYNHLHIFSNCFFFQIDSLSHKLLKNRGPDAEFHLSVSTDQYNILFSGFVLWQQGTQLCIQPHSYKHHIILLNGDIFSKRDDSSQSDTHWLMQSIDDCNDSEQKLLDLFQNLQGPYSLIYFNQKTQNLYFIRDLLGRQSLLLAKCPHDDIILSSVLGNA